MLSRIRDGEAFNSGIGVSGSSCIGVGMGTVGVWTDSIRFEIGVSKADPDRRAFSLDLSMADSLILDTIYASICSSDCQSVYAGLLAGVLATTGVDALAAAELLGVLLSNDLALLAIDLVALSSLSVILRTLKVELV